MAVCSYCGTTILFGGIRKDEYTFCSAKCAKNGAPLVLAKDVPLAVAEKTAREIFFGTCPRCHGNGPVDVHNSYEVSSFIFVTNSKSTPHVCCRSCGNKFRIKGLIYSLFLGWWGVPWGVVMTPLQIVRNLTGLLHPADNNTPSADLIRIVRIGLASQSLADTKKPS